MRKLALMLLALLLVALVPPGPVAANPACHWVAPCGSEYSACTGWSYGYYCDAPTCSPFERDCGDCTEQPCWGPALIQPAEHYRVCYNSSGQQCIDYQHFWINIGCGC